ncbi:hypothetical protein EWW49_34875, partial [Pseudomonas syringae]
VSWLGRREGVGALWGSPAVASLTRVAVLRERVGVAYGGRAYAAYGGIYIVASIAWLGLVERVRPLGTDWLGLAFCVRGATIILLGPRWAAS